MQNQTSIKKLNLTYAKCHLGGLHSGEVMNLICVDSNCSRRGIICPICRMKNHQECQILPLKVFLQQIKKLFLQSDDSSSLNNLSDYLRSIQNSKKQMMNILREAAQSIAEQFKAIEAKINQNYNNIRRNVLTQSSISTKLPNLVNLLTERRQKDAISLQQQFQKYSQLLKYENSKMNVSDKAKKLVQQYSLKPNSIKSSLNQQVKSIHSKFNQIFFNKAVTVKEVSQKYTFSTQNKSYEITVGDNNKIVSTNLDLQNLGLAYIKEGVGQLKRKITFQIIKLTSNSISLGMGNPQNDKDFAFVFDPNAKNKHFLSQCQGYNNQAVQQDSQEQQPDKFHYQKGSQVTIEFQGDKNKIIFSKKDDDVTRQINLSLSEDQKKKLQFVVVLAEQDEVKIVNN